MRPLAWAFALALLPAFAWAGEPGTASGEFLKLPIAPVPASMGDAHAAMGGPDAPLYNPAAIVLLKRPALSAAHSEHVVDIRQEYLSYAFGDRALGTFALTGSMLSSGDIDAFDANDVPLGTISTRHGFLSATLARRFGGRLGLGVSPKYVFETLDDASASTFALDVGAVFEARERLRFGASVSNLGGALRFVAVEAPLPKVARLGAAYELPLRYDDLLLTAASDLSLPSDDVLRLGLGVQAEYKKLIALRGGFRTGQDLGSGLSAGLSLILDRWVTLEEVFKGVRVDYAYIPQAPFTAGHRLGLQVNW